MIARIAAGAALLMPAAAVGAQTTDPRAVEAGRRCAAGEARVGVALLMRVHVDTLEPRYVLDQAECLERNGLRADAAERLEFYLTLKDMVTESDRLGAQLWLDRLHAKLGAPGAVAGRPRGSRQQGRVQRVAVQRQGETQSLTDRPHDPPRRKLSPQRTASLLLAAGAGGVLAGAITMQVARESRAADYNRRCFPLHGANCDQMLGRVQTAQMGAVIGYAAAALLAGGAIYFHATSPERRATELQAFRCRQGERSGELVCGTMY